MADTVTVPQGVDSRTPLAKGPEETALEPVYRALSRLRGRLVDELVDIDPDPMLCRLSWILEEAAADGIEKGILLSWIGTPDEYQCQNPPCFRGLIFEGDPKPAECHVCLGTGCKLTPEEFAMIEAEIEADRRTESERMGG